MRLVLIEWIDACSVSQVGRWSDKSLLDDVKPEACKSIGWVHSENDQAITIFSHDAGEQVGGDFCIPRCCIVSIRDVAL